MGSSDAPRRAGRSQGRNDRRGDHVRLARNEDPVPGRNAGAAAPRTGRHRGGNEEHGHRGRLPARRRRVLPVPRVRDRPRRLAQVPARVDGGRRRSRPAAPARRTARGGDLRSPYRAALRLAKWAATNYGYLDGTLALSGIDPARVSARRLTNIAYALLARGLDDEGLPPLDAPLDNPVIPDRARRRITQRRRRVTVARLGGEVMAS